MFLPTPPAADSAVCLKLVRSCFVLLGLLVLPYAFLIAQPVIQFHSEDPNSWTIRTTSSEYQIIYSRDGNLANGHWGPPSDHRVFGSDWGNHPTRSTEMRDLPYRGGFQEMIPAIEVIFPDGVREMQLNYERHEILEIEGRPALRIDMKDTHYPLVVSQFVRIFPELDVMEKWYEIRNIGSVDTILVERAYSGSFILPPGDFDLTHLSGAWGREYQPRTTQLTSGSKTLEIRTMKGFQHVPAFLVRPRGETAEGDGGVWFGQLAWTGNWRLDFEVGRNERLQITGGVNHWDTHWNLGPGASFTTPRLMVGYADDGASGASRRMQRYIADEILPKPAVEELRKVVYNSWFATEFRVNEAQQMALAEKAAAMGTEVFMMDDGWFRGRKDDTGGLGDWQPDPDKFPRGLNPLIDHVKGLGMDFGIWVEPEMVNPNSDLFREHPDWALHTPNRIARMVRTQLVLNMARDDVRDFTLGWLDELLSNHDIRYLKWDMNRHFSEVGWPEAPLAQQREVRIRYVQNLYYILEHLRARHPHVTIETCAGGGVRMDPGILAYSDIIWTSDNTDPVDRIFIHYGASFAFPARLLLSLVTDHERQGRHSPLAFRFQVGMLGVLGIGGDLNQWSQDDMDLAARYVAQYKRIREVIQRGDQYRLTDPTTSAGRLGMQYVARDGSESVVFLLQPEEFIHPQPITMDRKPLRLRGLDPDGRYVLSEDAQGEYTGRSLMEYGLPMGVSGVYSGKIIRLSKTSSAP